MVSTFEGQHPGLIQRKTTLNSEMKGNMIERGESKDGKRKGDSRWKEERNEPPLLYNAQMSGLSEHVAVKSPIQL